MCLFHSPLQRSYLKHITILLEWKCMVAILVAVRLIKHRPVPGRASSGARTGIGRFVKRFFNVLSACQTSYDVRPGTVGIVR